MENQIVHTDNAGKFQVNIGTGKKILGSIDSIIWTDGAYFLKLSSDTNRFSNPCCVHECQLRDPIDVTPEGLEGSAEASEHKEWGAIIIPNKKNKTPHKITADLITSYINTDYPGGEYPIYRHYEWFLADGVGNGNSLALTYSKNTTHAFFENSKKLGEVKLYNEPFQELNIITTPESIEITLSKPIVIKNYSVTYAIKGPWRIFYHIEW